MDNIYERLEESILAGRAMHAYLITGADPFVTDTASRNAASVILYGKRDAERLSDDPDYMEYSGSISISVFRDVIRPEIYREAFGKSGRVVVFRAAHQLSQGVQNAMLKVLEEPPKDTYFFLTGIEHGILSTIRSRCMVLRCGAANIEAVKQMLIGKGLNPAEAERTARMSGGITARAIKLLDDDGFISMREGVLNAFFSALKGAPEFKWAKTKYDRPDYSEANEFMLLACHDLMQIGCGKKADFCVDKARELENAGSRFTIGEISCIIDRLTDNAERLSTNAPAGAVFDRLFAELGRLGASKARGAKKTPAGNTNK